MNFSCVTGMPFAGTSSLMPEWLSGSGDVALAFALVVVVACVWLINLVALPGNWIAVLVLAAYAWLGPTEGVVSIGLAPVVTAFVFALLGELFEFLAGAAGAKRAGASRKSTLYSIIGSMAGAILGAIIGVPIPVIGSVIAAILFGGLGAAAGAMYGEWTDGRDWKENWTVGKATFLGRTFGTMGKILAGFMIVVIAAVSVIL